MIQIIQGKIVEDGNVVVPSMANDAHIMAVKKANQLREALNSDDGLEIDIDMEESVKIEGKWKCVCDKWIYVESEGRDEADALSELPQTKKCRSCSVEYGVSIEDGCVSVRLK